MFFLAALQHRPVLNHSRWLLTVLWPGPSVHRGRLTPTTLPQCRLVSNPCSAGRRGSFPFPLLHSTGQRDWVPSPVHQSTRRRDCVPLPCAPLQSAEGMVHHSRAPQRRVEGLGSPPLCAIAQSGGKGSPPHNTSALGGGTSRRVVRGHARPGCSRSALAGTGGNVV